MTTSFDDSELVERAKAGCGESATALVALHQVAVVHYAARMLARGGLSRADAEDVAQESLVRALTRLGRYDARWAFSTWLFAIARRRCLNHMRTVRRRAGRETSCAASIVTAERDDPQAVAAAREQAERLWAIATRELSERQFTALWLRTVEDLPVAEIARVLRRPPATVKVLLFRSRRRLAAALDSCDEQATLPMPAATAGAARRCRHG